MEGGRPFDRHLLGSKHAGRVGEGPAENSRAGLAERTRSCGAGGCGQRAEMLARRHRGSSSGRISTGRHWVCPPLGQSRDVAAKSGRQPPSVEDDAGDSIFRRCGRRPQRISTAAGDVAQVGAGQLEHPADAAAQHHLGGREGEARDLVAADLRRDGERVGVGDEVHERRAGVGERLLQRPPGRPPGFSTRIAWMPTAAAMAAKSTGSTSVPKSGRPSTSISSFTMPSEELLKRTTFTGRSYWRER